MTVVRGVRNILAAALVALAPLAVAGSVTVSYVDGQGNSTDLTVDASSSPNDLELAAALMAEIGVGLAQNATGSGSPSEIAAALAEANPIFAADVAVAMSKLFPGDRQAIEDAVAAVPGVNVAAVIAAVRNGGRVLPDNCRANQICASGLVPPQERAASRG